MTTRRKRGRRGAGKKPTPRELEVLELLMKGLSTKQVVDVLGITEHGVRKLYETVARKLGTSNRVETIVEAIRLRYLSIDFASEEHHVEV